MMFVLFALVVAGKSRIPSATFFHFVYGRRGYAIRARVIIGSVGTDYFNDRNLRRGADMSWIIPAARLITRLPSRQQAPIYFLEEEAVSIASLFLFKNSLII